MDSVQQHYSPRLETIMKQLVSMEEGACEQEIAMIKELKLSAFYYQNILHVYEGEGKTTLNPEDEADAYLLEHLEAFVSNVSQALN